MEENAALRATGRSRGHFIADLSRPGHLTARLRAFQTAIGSTDENWDAAFSEFWTTADFVDCIISYVATSLALELSDPTSVEGADMLRRVGEDGRAVRQLLLLVHLYADCDAGTLKVLRRALLKPPAVRPATVAGGVVLLGGTFLAASALLFPPHRHSSTSTSTSTASRESGGASSFSLGAALSAPFERIWEEIDDTAPFFTEHPKLTLTALTTAGAAAGYVAARSRRQYSLARAAAVLAPIRVVKHRPVSEIAALLNATFSYGDGAELIRSLCIGISAHQKLDHLSSLLQLLGFDSLALFADCIDEISLLDPVAYPQAIKTFAKETCRNDFLNFGRMHLFFPDSRLALDLNTDRTLKEARFDRHHVRDLAWSRHQLEELAERRFLAAQLAAQRAAAAALGETSTGGGGGPAIPHHHHQLLHQHHVAEAVVEAALSGNGGRITSFHDLFKDVKAEDFSSYFSKLQTPRELMIMMSELFARMESNPGGGVSAQDLEIATQRAVEQAV